LSNQGKVEDFYQVEPSKLGVGGFGEVRNATFNATGQPFAVKTIRKADIADVVYFQTEIEISRALDHPQIIRLFETFEDRCNVYLVMEVCNGGELFDVIVQTGHFSERQAAVLMHQLCCAVAYLHAEGICHRDLKPENLLFVSRGPVETTPLKLIDFGLARRFKADEALKTSVGTPLYAAPEVIRGLYGAACDLWSCGVILFLLLCGCPPFDGSSPRAIIRAVKKGRYSLDDAVWQNVSKDAKDLVRGLLEKDTQKRLTAAQVLEHGWIQGRAPNASGEHLGEHLVENLRKFGLKNNFQKAAITLIAAHLKESQIKVLREAFIALDTDHDGALSVQELRAGLVQVDWEIPVDLHQLMEAMDSHDDHKIKYTEFLAAALDMRTYTREDICWQAFKTFDRDRNGMITMQELRLVLAHEDLKGVLDDETREALRAIDTNGDGKVDFDEFMRMMASD